MRSINLKLRKDRVDGVALTGGHCGFTPPLVPPQWGILKRGIFPSMGILKRGVPPRWGILKRGVLPQWGI